MDKQSLERRAAEEDLGLFESVPPDNDPQIELKPEHLAVILGQCNMSLNRARAKIIAEQRNDLAK